MTFKLIAAFSAAALAGIAATTTSHAQSQDAATVAAEVCASCHGPKGNGVSPAFPKLAGQQKDYLEIQLKSFRDRTRADPMAQAYMWGMASQLSDDMITKLAAYYSQQTPSKEKATDPKAAQAGQAIFQNGLPAAGVPACQTCHMASAQGNGPIPRLADQHAEYLVKQLVSFKTQVRAEAAAPPMHAVTARLAFEQMENVASYLATRAGH